MKLEYQKTYLKEACICQANFIVLKINSIELLGF